jgi:tRNA pseudouridine55 synthase
MDLDGYLLVDKPAGWTSHDVVAKIRGILKKETGQKVKVGHTGTLDPFATGLLVIVVGSYTKRAAEFSKLDKTYEAEVTLGATSTTGDPEGEITGNEEWGTNNEGEGPTPQLVQDVLKSFVEEIEQTPHAFSAIKVEGQRAYKLARAGKEVVLEPRKVTIHSIENVEYDYPKLKFTARVSSGTYIRSLAEDIGQKLGTGAYLSVLRRTNVGKHSLGNALKVKDFDRSTIINKLQKTL